MPSLWRLCFYTVTLEIVLLCIKLRACSQVLGARSQVLACAGLLALLFSRFPSLLKVDRVIKEWLKDIETSLWCRNFRFGKDCESRMSYACPDTRIVMKQFDLLSINTKQPQCDFAPASKKPLVFKMRLFQSTLKVTPCFTFAFNLAVISS